MVWVEELIHVDMHGPFGSQEEAEAWLATLPEPENPDTVLHMEETEA